MHLRRWQFVLFVVSFLAGCFGRGGTPDPSPEELPFRDVTITVSVPKGSGYAARWDSLLIEWSARTGAAVHVVEESGPEDADSNGDSGNATVNPSSAALLVFPVTELSDRLADGRLAPIPAESLSESSLHWNDIPGSVAAAVGTAERRPVVLPIAAPVLVLYYRIDLLEKAGLAPPSTWDDYQKLLDSLDRWAPGLTVVEPWSEDFRATMFLARAATLRPPGQVSFFFDIETGDPLADSQAFARAWELSQAATAKMPKEVAAMSPAECRRQILEGKAALAISYEIPAAPDSATEQKRAADVRIGFARLPGSRTVYNRGTSAWETAAGGVNRCDLTGFAGLCAGVSSKATPEQAQAAWNLIATLTAPGTLEAAFPGAARSPVRLSQLATAAGWTGHELTAAEAEEHHRIVTEVFRDKTLLAEIPIPGREEFRRPLTSALGDGLTEKKAATDVLPAIQAAWTQSLETIGREKLRDTYRRRLGLTPLRPDQAVEPTSMLRSQRNRSIAFAAST